MTSFACGAKRCMPSLLDVPEVWPRTHALTKSHPEASKGNWAQPKSNAATISIAALAAAVNVAHRRRSVHQGASRGGTSHLGRSCGRIGMQAVPHGSTTDSRIIPREILFGNPEYGSPSISPDAQLLAYLKPSDKGVLNVWVRTVGATDDRQVTNDGYRGIRFFTWAEDSQTLLYLQDSGGDENFHVWGINAAIAESVAKDLTPYDGVKAQNLSTNKRHPNTILVGMNKRNPQLFDMYRVDLQTAEATLDTENPGDVLGWAIEDETFTIRGAVASNPINSSQIVRVRDSPDDEWRELITFPYGEEGGLVSFSKDAKTCLVKTSIGSDTMELVRMDLATGAKVETIAANPDCDIGAVMQDEDTKEILAVSFTYARLERQFFNEAVKADFAFLEEQRAEGAEPLVVSRDRKDQSWVVGFRRDDGPMEYAIYSRVAKTVTPLFVSQPALKEYKLAQMECVKIEARDGLCLTAYLTRSRTDVATPMVLLVHGGPWARDVWGFNASAQWLANRGYAVLQVNYRASTGFGKSFLHAGDCEWGAKMQDDLTDAVRWAVSQGVALEDKVCIYGGSYGGYACLAGLTFTPDVYACGVDIVGPSNAKTLLDSIPPYWKPIRNDLLMKVGNVDEDEDFNRKISPLFHADKIKVPLLIGQGANDPRVKQAEADQIVQEMMDKNIPVDYVLYPDEGHGFARPQNRIDFQGRTEIFLEKHLGGRSESFTQPEGATTLLPILDGTLGKIVATSAPA